MKQVHVRRHAPKHSTGGLTDEGKKLAKEFKSKIGRYDLIVSSDKPRAIETALLITGIEPVIDKRAGTPPFTAEQERQLHELGQNHPYGIAGVILDNPEYRVMIKVKGESLGNLIKETLKKLPKEGKALIISHDGVMVAAEGLLKNKSLDKAVKTYKPLMGFVVYEDGTIEDLA
jgi:broad specificity phosphatase PhoE